MANQSAGNVLVALKRQTTMGTPEAGGAGASQLRILDSSGLKLARANIASAERRADLTEHIGRLGGKTVAGQYICEINPGGAFDLLVESLVRGTWGSLQAEAGIVAGTWLKKVEPPSTPVLTQYTVEQYDADIDESEVFDSVRVTEMNLSMQPGQMSQVTFSMMGLDRNLEGTGTAPYFTSPSVTSGIPLIADDAAITYKGSAITTLTGLDLTVAINAAGQPVIGSFVGPDVFLNTLMVSGNLTAVRQDLQALTDFDAETEFAIKGVLQAPGTDPVLTFAFNMPRVKIMDIDAPFLGGDAAKVETRNFKAHAPAGQSNAIEFYTSTETPTDS